MTGERSPAGPPGRGSEGRDSCLAPAVAAAAAAPDCEARGADWGREREGLQQPRRHSWGGTGCELGGSQRGCGESQIPPPPSLG
jgi:hypothetical protein